MPIHEGFFGKVVTFDPTLSELGRISTKLSLKEQGSKALYFVARTGRVLSIHHTSTGRGPDRIVVEKVPTKSQEMPKTGWSLMDGTFRYREKAVFSLKEGTPVSSPILPVISDFPGHLRMVLGRKAGGFDPELQNRLETLSHSLKATLTEAVEIPILGVIGFGQELVPKGDAALCGLLLTGKAFSQGRRIRADWQTRLAIEIRRFFHRTSVFSSAFLHYAIEGRITEIQERFFRAMERDFETLGESTSQTIIEAEEYSGIPFLQGVYTALEMIRTDLSKAGKMLEIGVPDKRPGKLFKKPQPAE